MWDRDDKGPHISPMALHVSGVVDARRRGKYIHAVVCIASIIYQTERGQDSDSPCIALSPSRLGSAGSHFHGSYVRVSRR